MIKRDDIIGKKRATPVTTATVPVWGEIYIRRLSAAEAERIAKVLRENDGSPANWQARFAVLVVSDENGNRIFTDADATELGNDPSLSFVLPAICEAGDKFNDRDVAEAKKNSEPTPTGSLPGEPQ